MDDILTEEAEQAVRKALERAQFTGVDDETVRDAVLEHAEYLYGQLCILAVVCVEYHLTFWCCYEIYRGMDPQKDAKYLWIAAEALTAELPEDWEQATTEEGEVFYYNSKTVRCR